MTQAPPAVFKIPTESPQQARKAARPGACARTVRPRAGRVLASGTGRSVRRDVPSGPHTSTQRQPLGTPPILGKDTPLVEFARTREDDPLIDLAEARSAFDLVLSHFNFVFDFCAKPCPPALAGLPKRETGIH